MGKYEMKIHYSRVLIEEIEADSREEAEEMAFEIAMIEMESDEEIDSIELIDLNH
jgi:hypothetical protein